MTQASFTRNKGALALHTPDGCHLWLMDLRHPIEDVHWQACSEAEHVRASRFRFERDASRYRAAHAQLRGLLSAALNSPAASIRWREGAHGKPHLLGHPGWHFNLSHSGDWGLLGLSRLGPIGVDIECHKAVTDLDLLVGQNFSDEEQAAWRRCPATERETFFYRTWVRKEASLKALGCGLTLEPRHVTTRCGALSDPANTWHSTWTRAEAVSPQQTFVLRVLGLALPPVMGAGVQAAIALPYDDPLSPDGGRDTRW
jgi:4'-phosphopantetheinyl transferase